MADDFHIDPVQAAQVYEALTEGEQRWTEIRSMAVSLGETALAIVHEMDKQLAQTEWAMTVIAAAAQGEEEKAH